MSTKLDKVWKTLIRVASERRTITYKDLAEAAGPGISYLSIGRQYLDDIADHCKANDLPDISTLVVNSKTNLPGKFKGSTELSKGDMESVRRVQRCVFGVDWNGVPRPGT